jgi:hypothetical protein
MNEPTALSPRGGESEENQIILLSPRELTRAIISVGTLVSPAPRPGASNLVRSPQRVTTVPTHYRARWWACGGGRIEVGHHAVLSMREVPPGLAST